MTASTITRQSRWERDQKLQQLGHADYAAYLKSPEWQAAKARYRKSRRPQVCGLCGVDEGLHFHHRTYERVGQELPTDLALLCGDCHRMLHVLERRGDLEGLDFDGLVDHARAEQNRATIQQRIGSPTQEQQIREAKRIASQTKTSLVGAIRQGINVETELTELDRLAAGLGTKLDR